MCYDKPHFSNQQKREREGATMANAATELPTAESIAKYVKKNSAAVKRAAAGIMMDKGHGNGMESVREDDYEGHHIVIRTSYTTTIDGKEIMAHLALTND